MYQLACALFKVPGADYILWMKGSATLYHNGSATKTTIIEARVRRSVALDQMCAGGGSYFNWERMTAFYFEYPNFRRYLLTPEPYRR